jgi:hypothetical protein
MAVNNRTSGVCAVCVAVSAPLSLSCWLYSPAVSFRTPAADPVRARAAGAREMGTTLPNEKE